MLFSLRSHPAKAFSLFLALTPFSTSCDTDLTVNNQQTNTRNTNEIVPTEQNEMKQDHSQSSVQEYLQNEDQQIHGNKTVSQFGVISKYNSPGVNTPVALQDSLTPVRLLVAKNQWAEASDALQTIVLNNPNEVEPLKLLSLCFLQLGEYRKALPYVEKGIKFSPDDGELYFFRGLLFGQTGKYTEALESLLKAESLTFRDESLDLQICVSHLNLNDYASAETRALNMLKQENSLKNGHAELILAFVAMHDKDVNTAREYYQICQEKGNCPPGMIQSLRQILEGK